MQITSRKIDASHLTANDAAQYRCQKALELRDKGDFDGAQEVMRPLWRGLGNRPDTTGLDPSVVPEVLLCVGILTGWIGSRNEIKEADGWARDLITQSITFYEVAGDIKKVAEARTELAYCYWREGSFNEARIMFTEALKKLTLEGKTRANALLGLSVVERSSSRYAEALKILTDNAPLFKKLTHHTLKGFYHNTLATVLRTQVMQDQTRAYSGQWQSNPCSLPIKHDLSEACMHRRIEASRLTQSTLSGPSPSPSERSREVNASVLSLKFSQLTC